MINNIKYNITKIGKHKPINIEKHRDLKLNLCVVASYTNSAINIAIMI